MDVICNAAVMFVTENSVLLTRFVLGEKHLSTFFGNTKDLTPEERGKHLEADAVRRLTLVLIL